MFFNFKKKGKLIKKENSILDDWANAKTVEGFCAAIERLPNPDVVLKNAGKKISVLRTLINHYQVGTCLDSRKAGTLSKKWEIRQNNCNKNVYDFFLHVFQNIDIYQLIEDILDAPLFGYNPIEINYERDGSFIYPVGLVAKPQEWFYFNSEGDFFFKDRTMHGKRYIDFKSGNKFLLPRHKATYLNPYGQAILSRCFWNVAFITGGMEFFIKFCEKFGMPYIFGRYERSASDIEKKDMLQGLISMVQDAIGVLPNDSTVEIVQTGSSGSSDIYLGLVNKCEANISKAILGQTLTTESGDTGSYALGKAHMGIREDIVNSDKRLVEKTINHFIKILDSINFDSQTTPEFSFVEEEDLGVLRAERDNKIYSLGVDFSEEYILRTYGYKKGDIEITKRMEPIGVSMNYSDTTEPAPRVKRALQPGLPALSVPAPNSDALQSALNSIYNFFEKTGDYNEALNQMAELYPELSTKELEENLSKLLFISELKGRFDVQQQNK